ncbi:unnamed protein product [Calypogeia fissa]
MGGREGVVGRNDGTDPGARRGLMHGFGGGLPSNSKPTKGRQNLTGSPAGDLMTGCCASGGPRGPARLTGADQQSKGARSSAEQPALAACPALPSPALLPRFARCATFPVPSQAHQMKR